MILRRTLIALALMLCAAAGFAQEQRPDVQGEQSDKTELDSLREYLSGFSITMDKAGIKNYLQRLADSNQDWTPEKKLLAQLGSAQFEERNAAEKALYQMPEVSLDLLQEATRDPKPRC